MGWFMSGRKMGKRKFSWKNRKTTAEITSKVTVSLSLTNIVVWVLKTPCLIYFSSIKFHFAEETQRRKKLYSVGENCCSITAQKMAKKYFSSFWHRLGHESARAPLCKLATCTRQLFLSKLKLLQTWQTGRKNKKQSKAEIGYD